MTEAEQMDLGSVSESPKIGQSQGAHLSIATGEFSGDVKEGISISLNKLARHLATMSFTSVDRIRQGLPIMLLKAPPLQPCGSNK